MIPLDLKFHSVGEPPLWPDDVDRAQMAEGSLQLAVLDRGMESGKPSVAIRFAIEDGSVVIVETSARLFCTAARMIMARYPALFDD
jgi:hypothetical protein